MNEEAHIEKCIQSLKRQSYPADRCELVIVDNGSSDETCSIVEQLKVHDPGNYLQRLMNEVNPRLITEIGYLPSTVHPTVSRFGP